MRRAIAFALAAASILVPVAGARAAEETPQGRFTSPSRAHAGAPMFVRSITPCPVTGGAYQWIRVGIKPQADPGSFDYLESTDGDLRADGSWEVTIAAPNDMPDGVTKAYSVHAQCIVHEAPYAAPERDPSNTTTTLPPTRSYFRYFLRPLHVTGFSAGDSDAGAESTDDGGEDEGDETTTTTSTSTTSTTAQTTATTTAIVTSSNDDVDRMDPVALKRDEQKRAAEARAELADQDGDGVVSREEVALLAATSEQPRPVDGGIPWWSFVLATMLAVGAVIAWGTRRSASVLD